ncbi:hypothetical protein DKM44_12150 [Deinococcus irradiatisoli]|uniref:VCBS repeat-containing protein n=1 Tax=Deinococcus irradiatisoli TaxID=2202254 RepID=A0A2Z3JFZ4_9DEIO|nr:hypothetical protein [Deinococcus irradiatisoli]AWN23885.1 hypothetical protein DKM44_12150 [Deinococcus irradiatisoli]
MSFRLRCAALLGLLALSTPVLAVAHGLAPVLITFAGEDRAALLGAWDGQGWRLPATAVPLVKAGNSYRVQGLGTNAFSAVGSAPVSADDPCPDYFLVNLTPLRPPAQTLIATRADLKARPRPVTALPTSNPVYREVVRGELQRRGLNNPVVQLRSLTRTDLDGDGKDEVIIEASHFADSDTNPPRPSANAAVGDYSLLLLRSVVNGRVQTTVLGEDVVTKGATDPNAQRLGNRFSLEGVADLDGDGNMELITVGAYYEGFMVQAWTWTPQAGPKAVLETGCGV